MRAHGLFMYKALKRDCVGKKKKHTSRSYMLSCTKIVRIKKTLEMERNNAFIHQEITGEYLALKSQVYTYIRRYKCYKQISSIHLKPLPQHKDLLQPIRR